MTLTDDRQPPARPMPAGGPGAAPGTSGATDPADRPTSVSPVQPAPGKPRWEQCDRCQSPVDPAQRYCVVCGTNQRRADDPAARYFAAARRRRIGVAAPVAVVGNGRTVSTTVAALLIALLPVAAGIGIVVGRGSADSGDQIIQALKASQGTRGTVVAGPAVDGTTPDTTAVAGDTAASDDPKAKKKGKEVDGVEQAPILSSGPAGDARKLEDNKPTAKDVAESKKAVEQINARKGKAYIDTQRDLPDTIVIP